MNRTKMLIVAVSAAVAFCAVAFVTADFSTSSTPLYTVRMEQASSSMRFLPTERNKFTYTTEKGYMLTCDVMKSCCGLCPERVMTLPAP
ncbi:MAG: hypothetical protein HXS48_16395 [Theionarchaea archaeon]|nr:hypothetical protein [Theionarchaea archaeon]